MLDIQPIRVAIVDDNEMVRTGLSVFLQSFDDFLLVGSVSDGADALLLCRECHPDVILMDLMMPGMNGIATTRIVVDTFPQIRVIAMTSFNDRAMQLEAKSYGAAMCLPKNISIVELADAIRQVYAHGRSCACEGV